MEFHMCLCPSRRELMSAYLCTSLQGLAHHALHVPSAVVAAFPEGDVPSFSLTSPTLTMDCGTASFASRAARSYSWSKRG